MLETVYCQYTHMLRFDLRKAMDDFEARTGLKITYDSLAVKSGISVNTLKSLATRDSYNTTLNIIEQIGNALRCNPTDYFIWSEDKSED